jgi:hypothetical protein
MDELKLTKTAVEDEKVITSELLEKSYEMAYFAELLLGEK